MTGTVLASSGDDGCVCLWKGEFCYFCTQHATCDMHVLCTCICMYISTLVHVHACMQVCTCVYMCYTCNALQLTTLTTGSVSPPSNLTHQTHPTATSTTPTPARERAELEALAPPTAASQHRQCGEASV